MDEDLQYQIDQLKRQLDGFKKNPEFIDHQHNGFDSTKIDFGDIDRKKLFVYHTIFGTQAATAGNYGVFYIVPAPCVLIGFHEVHQTAGTDGGTVSVTLEKLTGTQAPDGGAVMLNAALSLKATINSIQDGVLTSTLSNRTLAMNDRLCLKDAGALTTVANVTVLVELKMI